MSSLFNIDRPTARPNYWNTYAGNIFLLLFCGGILLAARFFPIDRLPLGYCVFLHLTGIPCPTCGFTRACCAFTHGNWAVGIKNCPLALLLYLSTIAAFIYNAAIASAALFGLRIGRGTILQLLSKKMAVFAVFFFLLLMANWIYRLIMGFT